MITMNNLYKTYGTGITALNGINLSIDQGEFVYVVGHSGAGKSTLVKLIYREELPTKGETIIRGIKTSKMKNRNIPYLRRTIGVVFQDFNLLPKMTVYVNVAFALEVIEEKSRNFRTRVRYVLELFNLKNNTCSLTQELTSGKQ